MIKCHGKMQLKRKFILTYISRGWVHNIGRQGRRWQEQEAETSYLQLHTESEENELEMGWGYLSLNSSPSDILLPVMLYTLKAPQSPQTVVLPSGELVFRYMRLWGTFLMQATQETIILSVFINFIWALYQYREYLI